MEAFKPCADNTGIRIFLRIFLPTFLSLMLSSLTLAEGQRKVGQHKDFTVSLSDSFTCQDTVYVRIDSSMSDDFVKNKRGLNKIVKLIRAVMSFECPSVKEMNLLAFEKNLFVGKSSISKDSGWAMNSFDLGKKNDTRTNTGRPKMPHFGRS